MWTRYFRSKRLTFGNWIEISEFYAITGYPGNLCSNMTFKSIISTWKFKVIFYDVYSYLDSHIFTGELNYFYIIEG